MSLPHDLRASLTLSFAAILCSACTGALSGGTAPTGTPDSSVPTDSAMTDAPFNDSATPMDGGTDSSTPEMDSGTPSDGGGTDAPIVIPLDADIDFSVPTVPSTQSTRESVLAFASAHSATPSITIWFTPVEGRTVSSIQIFRKSRDATAWGSVYATPSASSDRYTDTGVSLGDYFEYKIAMSTSAGMAHGYVSAGVETPARHYNGKLLLLVDSTIEPMITTPIATLIADLEGEGWNVTRLSVSQSASVSSVRSMIQSAYTADPTNVKAVFLLGHLPVPYSGTLNPDGHGEHYGAWPCDGYYGELDSTWSDSSANAGNNSPGDGRWDPNDFPSAVELQVGRVDMHNMDGFSASIIADDPVLYTNYLSRDHRYRARELEPRVRGYIVDNFDTDPYEPADYRFAGSGWRNMVALMGPFDVTQQLTSVYDGAYIPYKTWVDGESYLWTYAAGGGGYTEARGIGTTWEFSDVETGGFFNMAFGSFFGDWDNNNNFLRAFIAGGNGLTSAWAGTTHWYFHHMGMGETIGFSTRLTMNNQLTSTYTPANGSCCGGGNIYLGLMGDPTLRQGMPAPASNFAISNSGGKFRFTWTASPEAVNGYHIYEITSSAITRITTSPVTDTAYTSTLDYGAGRRFSVRALRLQSNLSGSHFDLSLGRVANAP